MESSIPAASENAGVLISIDETLSVGGDIHALEVLATSEGGANIFALETGVNINPVQQHSGVFENADSILVKAVNQLTALSSGGAGNISVFVADNDTITIGHAAKYGEMEIVVDTGASGAGVQPVFEYSTGSGT